MSIGDVPDRVGRWASVERREARRDEVLDVVVRLLEEQGYERTSMLNVASAARMSKETLYAWFGDRAGLFEAVVAREAESMNMDLAAALEAGGDRRPAPREVLERFGGNVLRLLLGPRSLAINRAAIATAGTSPELGRILATRGRETTRPLVERYLAEESDAGRLNIPDAGEAFEILMGLLVRDLQIRCLLGVARPPGRRGLKRRAQTAVAAFVRIYG